MLRTIRRYTLSKGASLLTLLGVVGGPPASPVLRGVVLIHYHAGLEFHISTSRDSQDSLPLLGGLEELVARVLEGRHC